MRLRRLGFFVFVLLFSLATALRAEAAVDLLYFLPVAGNDHILLTWETAQELNNAGFYVLRSERADGTFARISPFIPSLDPFSGNYYEYDDRTPQVGVIYYYRLEAVDAGGYSTFHPEVPVQASLTAPTYTPTPTATSTAGPTQATTPTLTRTPTFVGGTPPAQTATPRPSAASTATNLPASATPTALGPTLTFTPTYPPTKTPTTTLMPLPEVTLVFPAFTPTLTASASPSPTLTPHNAVDIPSDAGQGIPPRLIVLAAVIFFLWVLLASFIFFYFRHLGR